MPDISKCINLHCKLAKDCYRFRAVPSHCQSYSKFKGGMNCDAYLSVELYKNVESYAEAFKAVERINENKRNL